MLAHQITLLRKRIGMSQSELARRLNISASTAGMYEQGRRIPNLDILVMMSRLFEVSLDYLITGSEYTYSDSTTRKKAVPDYCPCSTCYWKEYVGQE